MKVGHVVDYVQPVAAAILTLVAVALSGGTVKTSEASKRRLTVRGSASEKIRKTAAALLRKSMEAPASGPKGENLGACSPGSRKGQTSSL